MDGEALTLGVTDDEETEGVALTLAETESDGALLALGVMDGDKEDEGVLLVNNNSNNI